MMRKSCAVGMCNAILRNPLKGWAEDNLTKCDWSAHLEEHFLHKEVQLKKFCLPVRTTLMKLLSFLFKKSIASKPYHSIHSEHRFAHPWVIQWLNLMDYNETIYFKTWEQRGLQSLMHEAQNIAPPVNWVTVEKITSINTCKLKVIICF